MRCAYCDGTTNVNHVDEIGDDFCQKCYDEIREEKLNELRDYIEDNFGHDLPDNMVEPLFDIGQHTLEQLYRDEWNMGQYETLKDFDNRMREESRIERLQDDWRDRGLGII
jgi:hypothetical protein